MMAWLPTMLVYVAVMAAQLVACAVAVPHPSSSPTTTGRCAGCDGGHAHRHPHAMPAPSSADDLLRHAVPFSAQAPVSGVNVSANPLLDGIMRANVDYLLHSFDLDHMLLPYRQRAGRPAPPGARPQVNGWDTGLKGSNSGRFLMGAGNTLRWRQEPALRTMLDSLIDGIDDCKNESGWMLAYPLAGLLSGEVRHKSRTLLLCYAHSAVCVLCWLCLGLSPCEQCNTQLCILCGLSRGGLCSLAITVGVG